MYNELLHQIKHGYSRDEFAKELLSYFEQNKEPSLPRAKHQLTNFTYHDGFLFWGGSDRKRLYVPTDTTVPTNIIQMNHEPAHFHVLKRYCKLCTSYYWRGMYRDTEQYCIRCHTCQVNKQDHLLLKGQLQPHNIPEDCWHTVTMDFLTELPTIDSQYNSVLVVVEKLSKRAFFIPTTEEVTAVGVDQLLRDRLFSKHVVPSKIISDQDAKFA